MLKHTSDSSNTDSKVGMKRALSSFKSWQGATIYLKRSGRSRERICPIELCR